jgi:hypothetical protein
MVLIEGEKNVAEFNNGNPSTYKEDAIGKARLMIAMLSSKGRKFCQKGNFITSLINGLGDARRKLG